MTILVKDPANGSPNWNAPEDILDVAQDSGGSYTATDRTGRVRASCPDERELVDAFIRGGVWGIWRPPRHSYWDGLT